MRHIVIGWITKPDAARQACDNATNISPKFLYITDVAWTLATRPVNIRNSDYTIYRVVYGRWPRRLTCFSGQRSTHLRSGIRNKAFPCFSRTTLHIAQRSTRCWKMSVYPFVCPSICCESSQVECCDIWFLGRSSFLTSGHSDAQDWAERQSARMSKITDDRLNPVWYRMLYNCTHMATVGVKGLSSWISETL